MAQHEHVFPEEQEPLGRLILAPCLVCEVSALDALDQVRRERDAARIDVEMWAATATDYLSLLLPILTEEQRREMESGALPDKVGAASWTSRMSHTLGRAVRIAREWVSR